LAWTGLGPHSDNPVSQALDSQRPSLAYTFSMLRVVLAVLGFPLILASPSLAQLKINVPEQHYKAREQIRAKVENADSRPVTICIGFLGVIENSPSPFRVERNSDGKWHTLIMGPDLGNQRTSLVLAAGESEEFFVRLSDSGRMRLRLDYWIGSIPKLDCDAPPKGSKLATSSVFTILREFRDDRGQLEEPF
jgi:hypothetical protein